MLQSDTTTVVSFGDSLSDTGNVSAVTGRLLIDPLAIPIPATENSLGYADGFSDGAVHPDRLAALLEADLVGYAVGGARVLGERPLDGQVSGLVPEEAQAVFFDPAVTDPERSTLLAYDLNIGAQVARFTSESGGGAPNPTADAPGLAASDVVLATFFGGLNDIADFAASAVDSPFEALLGVDSFIEGLVDGAETAIAGIAASPLVDQIAVFRVPSITFFPQPEDVPPAAVSLLGQVVDGYNAGLEGIVGSLSEVEAVTLELDRMLAAVDEDPETFGFVGKGPFFLGSGSSLTDAEVPPVPPYEIPLNPSLPAGVAPDQVQFVDTLHYSSQLHGVVGAYAAAALTKEAEYLDNGGNLRLFTDKAHFVLADDGDDRIFTGRGEDVILAGEDDDLIFAGLGDDVVSGGSGADDLRGSFGDDVLAGGSGDDVLRGGFGDDILIDGAGNDTAFGGVGDDTFIWIAPEVRGFGGSGDADVVSGGVGEDTLYLVLAEGFDLSSGIDLAALGIEASGIEDVVALAEGRAPLDLESGLIEAPNLAQLTLAYDWGFV